MKAVCAGRAPDFSDNQAESEENRGGLRSVHVADGGIRADRPGAKGKVEWNKEVGWAR
jgi:hypothetical protein